MKLSDLIPSSDILKQVEGVEEGLAKVKQFGRIGWIGVAISLATAIAAVLQPWLTIWNQFIEHWPLFLLFIIPLFSIFAIIWSKFYFKESQQPFRYTFSIAAFTAVSGTKEEQKLSWLSHDLSEKLNSRIKRLSLLEDKYIKEGEESKSHIHISGDYGYRQDVKSNWFFEVMPRIRVGASGKPETLAHKVEYPLTRSPSASEGESPIMTRMEYEQILERAYFSVASEIYIQIQKDVRQKIELLPTEYFRAIAFFHEAEDYAKSNTLNAYLDAANLYYEAMIRLDPTCKPKPKSIWRRFLRTITELICLIIKKFRQIGALFWARLGRGEIICARAQSGYANMLIYRYLLAYYSGQHPKSIFEARKYAEEAKDRLEKLSSDIPEIKSNLFDTYITLSLAYSYLGSVSVANEYLEKAHQKLPSKADNDSRYLHAAGVLEGNLPSKLHIYQRAVELDPMFEILQFEQAAAFERLWRIRPSLERNVAEMVFKEYEDVLKIDPGNISAWANQGYLHWLLGSKEDIQQAERDYDNGREYKTIKRETFVAELDYGYARIAAEKGDFLKAYEYYYNGVSNFLSKFAYYGTENVTAYWFLLIDEAIMQRFERYKNNVEENYNLWVNKKEVQDMVKDIESSDLVTREKAAKGLANLLESISTRITKEEKVAFYDLIRDGDLYSFSKELINSPTDSYYIKNILENKTFNQIINKYIFPQRIIKSVYSFMLVDYGDACEQYYWRSADTYYRNKATEAYEKAKEINPSYVMAHFRLGQLYQSEELLQKAIELEPGWSEALLQLAWVKSKLISGIYEQKDNTAESNKRADNLAKESLEIVKKLIPHQWAQKALGTPPSDMQSREITRMLYNKEIEWPRECEEIHVRALITLGEIYASLPGKVKIARAILEHICNNFWQNDFDLHRYLVRLPAETLFKHRYLKGIKFPLIKDKLDCTGKHLILKGYLTSQEKDAILKELENELPIWEMVKELNDKFEKCRKIILDNIDSWLSEDSSRYSCLTWARYPGFEKEDESWYFQKLVKAMEVPNRPPTLYSWIGNELDGIVQKTYLQDTFSIKDQKNNSVNAWEIDKYSLEAYRKARESVQKRINDVDCTDKYNEMKSWLEIQRNDTYKELGSKCWKNSVENMLLLTQDKYIEVRQKAGILILGTQSHNKPLEVESIIIDVHANLAESIKNYLPKIQAIFFEKYNRSGIRIPLFRVNAVNLPLGSYTITIKGKRAGEGSISIEQLFCPDYAVIREILPDLKKVYNPDTGRNDGAWVKPSDQEAIRNSGARLWDYNEYLLHHLEEILANDLSRFLGMEEIYSEWGLLQEWREDFIIEDKEKIQREKLIRQALPNLDTKVQFMQVLRALVKESVPINDPEPVLQTFRIYKPENRAVIPIAEYARRKLKDKLPGNDGSCRLLQLSPDFEETVRSGMCNWEGNTFWIEPETKNDLLSAVRETVDSIKEGKLAIVTQAEGIRPFVRRLIEQEFPSIAVLSINELNQDLLNNINGKIEYTSNIKHKAINLQVMPEEMRLKRVKGIPGSDNFNNVETTRPKWLEIGLHSDCLKLLFHVESEDTPVSVLQLEKDNKDISGLFSRMADHIWEEVGIRVPDIKLIGAQNLEYNCFSLKINENNVSLYDGISSHKAGNTTVDKRKQQVAQDSALTIADLIEFIHNELRKHAELLVDTEIVEYELALLSRSFPEIVISALETINAGYLKNIIKSLLIEGGSVRDLRSILERALIHSHVSQDQNVYIVEKDNASADKEDSKSSSYYAYRTELIEFVKSR